MKLTSVLWFKSWHPSSAGATVGVCIALFALSIFDRYMHAMWRACNAHWARGRVWFALPVSRGELAAYEDGGQVVMASSSDRTPPTDVGRTLTNRTTGAGAGAGLGAGAGAGGAAGVVGVDGDEGRRGSASSQPPVFTSCATGDEKVLEKQSGSCCGGGVPAACNCGCGGECGQSSSPLYTVADPSRGLDKSSPYDAPSAPSLSYPSTGNARSRSKSHLPAAVAGTLDPARVGRWSRPFRPAVDIPRGLMWTFITALHYALMLVVMTFQIWWIISVVVGAGVGEMLFGRFGATR